MGKINLHSIQLLWSINPPLANPPEKVIGERKRIFWALHLKDFISEIPTTAQTYNILLPHVIHNRAKELILTDKFPH